MEDIITKTDFKIISGFIKKICGISLDYNKEYLIRHRLCSLLEKKGFDSYSRFSKFLETNCTTSFNEELISSITVNESMFFRDMHPFDALSGTILKELFRDRKKINIWSAGCSTGQEPYSIAMVIDIFVKENSPEFDDVKYTIIASDIDPKVLAYAESGIYSKFEVSRGLDDEKLAHYFTKQNNGYYKIKSFLKEHIKFVKVNFKDMDIEIFPMFHLIMLRNVLIYFCGDLKTKIIKQVENILHEDGYLIIGSSENLYSLQHNFKYEIIGNTYSFRKIV